MTRSGRRDFCRTFLGGAAGLALASKVVNAVPQSGSSPISVTKITDTFSLIRGAGSNVLLLNGPDGALMVNSGTAERSAELLKVVADQTGAKPVRFLFNTDWHLENTGSNDTLGKAGATIIAHENTRLWMTTEFHVQWQNKTYKPRAKEALPNKTFFATETITFAQQTEKMTFGGEEIHYGYLGQAHTDGDIYVFFPKPNVLVIGGIVSKNEWPLIDWWTGGWIGGLATALETLSKIADAQTRIVTATGPILTRADLQAQQEMYRTINTRLQQLIRKGKSPDEAIAAEPTKEFNDKMGRPETFIRLAFQSLWGQLSPDA